MGSLLLFLSVLTVLKLGICAPCSLIESLDISGAFVHENGSVFMNNVEFKKETWYEMEVDGEMKRYGCPCVGRVCLWKCCGDKQAYLGRNCTDTELSEVNPFSPPVYKGREQSAVVSHETFFYMYGRPCQDLYLVDSSSTDELYLQENGTLFEVASGELQWHPPKGFCIDMRYTDLATPPVLIAGVCFPENEETGDDPILYTAYAIGLFLSLPFLLATFLVYALIPELRNLHGMCLMAYCAGLIVAFPTLAYLKLHIGRVGVQMEGCLALAFIIYCAFQTSFFWLNVMCFDIWRTFSGYRGGSTNKRRENRRFALYAVYAWGVPLALTACTVGMQFSNLTNFITPGFGSRSCWFVDWLSELVYFYTPVLILVVSNIVFFSVTAHRIRSIKQETAILKGAESSRSDKLKKDKQRYMLYLKLFLVMGVNWSVELISFAVGGSNWYWILTDISNIMLGVFIFFIFVWKKKVRLLAQKRFRNIFGMEPSSADSRAARWNTSSAPTEDTRVSADDSAMRLKEMH